MTRRHRSATLFVTAAWCVLAVPASAQNSGIVARAASVTGHVQIQPASTGTMQTFALTAGYQLNPGDRVDTRGGGRLVIDLSDGSVVIVQPETVLTIKDFRAAESLRELFQITLGVVRVKINHFVGRPNPYRMNSPTASIAVRGTEFSVTVDSAGETKVEVYEGAVEVASLDDPNRHTLVQAGSGVIVRPGQDLLLYSAPMGGGGGGDIGQRGPARDRKQDGNANANSGPAQPQMKERNDSEHAGGVPPNSGSFPGGPQQAGGGGQPQGQFPQGGPSGHHDFDGGNSHPMQAGDSHIVAIDDNSPRATASTYDRYIAGLTELGQIPFVTRYTAYPEVHLDAFENPAYASVFRHAEGRLFFLPTWSGANALMENSTMFGPGGTRPANSSYSPQFSLFTPVGSRLVIGANVTASHVTSTADATPANSSSSGTFYSGSFISAFRFGDSGRDSLGFSVERLRGTGSAALLSSMGADFTEQSQSGSDITQTRYTLGYSHDFAGQHRIGLFYRYGVISASDAESQHLIGSMPVDLNSTVSTGHSSEIGFRLRGPITKKLFYGASAGWLGLSLSDAMDRTLAMDSHQRDYLKRGTFSFGLGYLLERNTAFTLDVSAGLSQSRAYRTEDKSGRMVQAGLSRTSATGIHFAVQHDFNSHFFVSGSILGISHPTSSGILGLPDSRGNIILVTNAFFPLTPTLLGNKFSDIGAGWRFTPDLTMQYVYSTDYGATSGSHALMLRYTFRLHHE